MKKGMTVIELLVGIATAAILVSVCAKVLQLGIVTYGFARRQNESLTRTRKAVAGDGSRAGILETSREGYQFASLPVSSVTVLASPTSAAANYYLKNGNLYRTVSGAGSVLADQVNSLSFDYYMSSNGLVSSTTVASSATMVTATVTIGSGTTVEQKVYTLFTGAQLRNHP